MCEDITEPRCSSQQVADIAGASSSYCNTLTIQLQGYEKTSSDKYPLHTALSAHVTDNPYWTDDTLVKVMQMTDGYHIKVDIDLVIEGDISSGNTNGMCFGEEPSTNGGYCITWVGDDVTDNLIARQGFNV